MQNTLTISNFKCFELISLELPHLTLLTGNNGVGKSSVIQALLLLRQVTAPFRNVQPQLFDSRKIQLNGYHRLDLGSVLDVSHDKHNGFKIDGGGVHANFDAPDSLDSPEALVNVMPDAEIASWLLNKNFYYLHAERRGPTRLLEIFDDEIGNSGDSGERVATMLKNAEDVALKIDRSKTFDGDDRTRFTIQVDRWMSYLFGDVAVKLKMFSEKAYMLKYMHHGVEVSAPNTGFGLTYALPIVMDGLAAPEGSMMIVENPEAHLHPKAQSNMGFFLARMAMAGVKMVIETHSEHIVNGVRRALLEVGDMPLDEAKFYFFEKSGEEPIGITMDKEGNLSDFPQDFFDQSRQDLVELMRIAATRAE